MLSAEELQALRDHVFRAQTNRLAVGENVPGNIRWSYNTSKLNECYELIFSLEWFLQLEEPPQEHVKKALFRAERLISDTLSKVLSNDHPELPSWQEVHLVGIWLYSLLCRHHDAYAFLEPTYRTAVHFIPREHLHNIVERFMSIAQQGPGKISVRWEMG